MRYLRGLGVPKAVAHFGTLTYTPATLNIVVFGTNIMGYKGSKT